MGIVNLEEDLCQDGAEQKHVGWKLVEKSKVYRVYSPQAPDVYSAAYACARSK